MRCNLKSILLACVVVDIFHYHQSVEVTLSSNSGNRIRRRWRWWIIVLPQLTMSITVFTFVIFRFWGGFAKHMRLLVDTAAFGFAFVHMFIIDCFICPIYFLWVLWLLKNKSYGLWGWRFLVGKFFTNDGCWRSEGMLGIRLTSPIMRHFS